MSVAKIGTKIREIRKQKGLSQEAVAEGVCHFTYVSKLENGQVPMPSAEILEGIAKNLGCSMQQLINDFDSADLPSEMLLAIVKVSVLRGDYDYALDIIGQLQEREDLLEYQLQQVTLNLTESLLKKGASQKALEILLEFSNSLEAIQSTDQYLLATVSNSLGSAYYNMRDLINAHSHYTRAYQISMLFPKEDLLTARISYNLGITCQSLRQDLQARLHLENAMKLYAKLGERKRLANSLYWLGISFKNLEQYDRAGDYIKQALALYEAENITKMAQVAKSQYAFYITSHENFEQAISEISQSLEVYENLGDISQWAFDNVRIANLYMDANETTKAKEALEKALSRLPEVAESIVIAYYYRTYAKYLAHIKLYDESLEYSFKSAELCDKMGLAKEKATSLRHAAETYQLQGKTEDAYSLLLEVTDLLSKTLDFLLIP